VINKTEAKSGKHSYLERHKMELARACFEKNDAKWTPHDAEEDGGAKNALKKYGSRNVDRDRRSHAKWANTSTRIPNKFAQLSDLTSCC